MKIICGLGNPGLKYRKTRHNAGWEVLDLLAKRHGIHIKKKARNSIYGEGNISGEKVLLIKPLTFMNNSGEAIRQWADYYHIDPATDLIVISDETSLAPGTIRIRKKGSAGGHNGLKNIIKHLGTKDFQRLRVGIGEPGPGDDMIAHVLGRMRKPDRLEFEKAVASAAEALELMIAGETDQAMNKFN